MADGIEEQKCSTKDHLGRGCDDCLFGPGKRCGSRGPEDGQFVIVGESPGASELFKGVPFVGPSGQVLEGLLPKDVDPYVTNALACLPRKKDPEVLAEAVRRCRPRLVEDLKKHKRKVILALGNGALWALTGDFSLKITQNRGKIFETEFGTVVAAVHPAFLLRGGGSYKKFKEDIELAVSILKGTYVPPYTPSTHEVVDTDEKVIWLKDRLIQQEYVASDLETSGFDPLTDYVLSTGFCFEDDKTYIVPGERLWQFKDVYENTNIKWIWHNGKFDIRFLRHNHILARVNEDTMLLNYALDETRGIHDLDQVAMDVIKAPTHKKMIDQYVKPKTGETWEDISYANIPRPILYEYQGLDLAKTFQVFKVLREKVANDHNLEKLYSKTLIPGSEFLHHLEAVGFAFDEDKWNENKTALEEEIKVLRQEIVDIAGYDINPNSPVQMCALAYDKLKIPCKQRSTAKEIVAKWPKSPLKTALQKYRKATKAYSTYVIGLRENVSIDMRAHSTYLLHGTRTGRLASRKPNLQNIPREKRMKGQFRAAPGYVLIDGDASQAELRSLAIQSGDPELCAIFNDTERSLHKEVATALFGPDYNDDQYVRAKAVNFGIAYGREAFSLAEEFDISVREAQAMIDGWFARFPVAKAYIEKCRMAPVHKQTIINAFGRKCRPGIVSRENMKDVQNQFANFPHQSTASDITLHVGMRIQPKLVTIGARIVNIVHDNLVVECPDEIEKVQQVQQWIEEAFYEIPREWGLTKVPFKSECKICYNWGTEEKEWLKMKMAA